MAQSESAKLFNDLFDLEKNYKHNVTVIKIQEEEIERCKVSKEILERTINANCDEIRKLKCRIAELEARQEETQAEHAREKQICEEVINRLTAKINETNRKHQIDLEAQGNEIKRRCVDLENVHMKILNEREVQYKKELSDMHSRLHEEYSNRMTVKGHSEYLVEENRALKDRLRDMEERLIPEVATSKNEMKTIKSDNANLKFEIECVKDELERCRSQSERLKKELQARQHQLTNLIKDNNEREVRNDNMDSEIRDCQQMNRNLIMRQESDKKERTALAAELDHLRQEIAHRGNDCDDILKQNEVLRSTIKGMKQERKELLKESRLGQEKVEERIGKIENLIELLKTSFVDCNQEELQKILSN